MTLSKNQKGGSCGMGFCVAQTGGRKKIKHTRKRASSRKQRAGGCGCAGTVSSSKQLGGRRKRHTKKHSKKH